MPAKRKPLPFPCPKCNRNNGTIQLVYFSGREEIIIRIGHYTPNRYRTTVKESNKTENKNDKNTIDKFNRKKRTSQRAWCSFRLDWVYDIDRIERKLEKRCGVENKNTITVSIPWSLKEQIKEIGWAIKPENPLKYRHRLQKNINYYENVFNSQ